MNSPPRSSQSFTSAHILQWNCRHINTNLMQFTQFLHSADNIFHVICLQSPSVRKTDLPVLQNYYYPPSCFIDNGKVRTATYILKSLQVSFPSRIPEVCADVCDVHSLSCGALRIINAYFPKGCGGENTQWLADTQGDNVLVVGDFNAHHSMWGGPGTSNKGGGQQLADHITHSGLCLLNNGTHTRLPDCSGQNPTAIDLSLISSNLYSDTEWHICDDPLGSDHLPILINIGGVSPRNVKTPESKYNYEKANWSQFSMQLEFTASNLDSSASIDVQYEQLRSHILAAADFAIPKKVIKTVSKFPPNPWWTQECSMVVKAKKRAFKMYKKKQCDQTFQALKETRIRCKRVIAQAKVEHWKKYLSENVNNYKDTRVLWKKVKQIKQRYCPAVTPLVHNGDQIVTDCGRAEVLADVFAKASQTNSLSEDIRRLREKEDANMKDPEPDFYSPINTAFSMSELCSCIDIVKNNKKATGSDPISYMMIQHFSRSTLSELLAFFNRCWEEGVVPGAWKQAIVVAVPKSGKPPSNPGSYRPISLTPHLGKIYERLVKIRLEYFLEKNKIIPPLQAGFKRGRGCIDHLVKISAHVKKALAKRRTVLAAFYDIKRAYDTVWHCRLLRKLASIGISGNMYQFCKSFLTGRSFQVKSGSAISQPRTVDMGVPQGSIVAPIMFNIMLHDINTVQLKNGQITLYADDLLLFSHENYRNLRSKYVRNVMMKRFQQNVDNIVNYMKLNGFELAAEKTVFMIFNRSRYESKEYSISIDKCIIHPSTEVKYLGLNIDRTLSWNQHIKKSVDKTNCVWNLLKMMKKTEGARDTKNLCHVIRALVRSRLLYGQEVFFAAIKSTIAKLQIRECKFLRFVLDMPNSVPQEVVYREAGWLPLTYEIKLRSAQYLYRASAVENSTDEELDLQFDNFNDFMQQKNFKRTPRINGRMISLPNYIEPLIKDIHISRSDIVPVPTCPVPPWQMEKMRISDDFGSLNKTANTALISSLAKLKISTDYKYAFQVYTDGSKLENDSVGGAFYIPSLQITKHYRLNDGVSIFTAELFSIFMALSFITDFPHTIHDVVILSDSRSALQALKSCNKNRREMVLNIQLLVHQLQLRGCNVIFQWVPSHSGIAGNEVVDSAAKAGAQLPSITNNVGFSVSEVSAKLRHSVFKDWCKQYQDKARAKDWVVPHVSPNGTIPNISRDLLPLFFRLRGKSYRTQFTPQLCICDAALTYGHIFECESLIPKMNSVQSLSRTYSITISRNILLTEHAAIGWKLVSAFLRELFHCQIGHLF